MNKAFADLERDDYVQIIEAQMKKFGRVWSEESFIKAVKHERTIFGYQPLFDEVHLHNNQIDDFDAFGTINCSGRIDPKITLNYVLNTNVHMNKRNVSFIFYKQIYSEISGWAELSPALMSNTMLLTAVASFEKNYPNLSLPDSYQNLRILT